MNTMRDDEPAASDGDTDIGRQADAMKDQLRKDVASWSAGRTEESARQAAELSVPVAKQPAPQPARRVKRATRAVPEVKPVAGVKKPFSMSYDGVSAADYITYMITRGAR